MCDRPLPLKPIFSDTVSTSVHLTNYPHSEYVGWFCLNIMPGILPMVLFILYWLSLVKCNSRPTFHFKTERRLKYMGLYVSLSAFLLWFIVFLTWHSFDVLSKSLCLFERANCPFDCSLENDATLVRDVKSFISWRPIFFTLSVVLPALPLLQLTIPRQVCMITQSIVICVVFALGILSFYLQKKCGNYMENGCDDCQLFKDGAHMICKLPLFELTFAFANVALLSMLEIHRKRETNGPLRRDDIETIRLSQNTLRDDTQPVQTSRDRWYAMIGY